MHTLNPAGYPFPFIMGRFMPKHLPMLRLEDIIELAECHTADLASEVATFDIGGREFNFNSQPYMMGVVNLSADSWYRESVCLSDESAVKRGLTLREQGASLVDVGAESSMIDAARVDETLQNWLAHLVFEPHRVTIIMTHTQT